MGRLIYAVNEEDPINRLKRFDLKVGESVRFRDTSEDHLFAKGWTNGIVKAIYNNVFTIEYVVGPDGYRVLQHKSPSKKDYAIGLVERWNGREVERWRESIE